MKWTEEEIEVLRRDYKGTRKSAEKIGYCLGRSGVSVKGKALALGLGKVTDYKRWTKEEEDKLAGLIGTLTTRQVARLMGRGVTSVEVRIKRLGLSRRMRDGWFTKAEVGEILGQGHKWVQKRIDGGELIASYHNGSRPKQNGGACWEIKEKDLRDFIREHSIELTGRNVDLNMIVYLFEGEN